jgi:hypothetical protein
LFPLAGQTGQLDLFDDDGESVADPANPPCLLHIEARWSGESPTYPNPLSREERGQVTAFAKAPLPPLPYPSATVKISRSGWHTPRWPQIQFEDASGNPLQVKVAGSNEELSGVQLRAP